VVTRNIDLRIILVDNGGGGIFSFLPQATSMDSSKFEKVFGTPHDTDLLLLAKAHGLKTILITTLEQLLETMMVNGPQVIQISTDRSENVRVHERINQMVSVAIRNS
jgi:2-succinyl-5-enolpyruvyl-6-hydroxy-3-cyclohexene-1-carboxylate synthase